MNEWEIGGEGRRGGDNKIGVLKKIIKSSRCVLLLQLMCSIGYKLWGVY